MDGEGNLFSLRTNPHCVVQCSKRFRKGLWSGELKGTEHALNLSRSAPLFPFRMSAVGSEKESEHRLGTCYG